MTTTARIGVLAAALALLAALFVVALQPAEAGGLNEQVSGNFIDTSLNIDDSDDVAASAWSGRTKGNGSASYEGILEIKFKEMTTSACPTGFAEVEVVAYSFVRRYENGDLRTSALVDGFGCFNPGTGVGSVDVNAMFTGGTGRYDGVTGGTYHASYVLQALLPDPTGGIAHGTFTGSATG